MRTFNLNGIELLSNRELAAVKGGGEEGIPTPIIIVEEGIGSPNAVETLTALFVVAPAKTAKPTKKKK